MTCKCPSCGGAINYREQDAGTIEACPHCSARLTLPASDTNVAARQRVRRGPIGALLKIVGLLLLIASFIWFLLLVSTVLMSNATKNAWAVATFASLPAWGGMLVGYVLFALGRKAGIGLVCSKCGNPIGKNATVCVACGADISP